MFQYIFNWWWYNPDVEEQKTFEKLEVEKKKDKVLEDIKTFDKSLLKKYKPLTPLQKMKKCKFRKKRKSKKFK
jgi:hypothetical protein